jgi:hypothetical protein
MGVVVVAVERAAAEEGEGVVVDAVGAVSFAELQELALVFLMAMPRGQGLLRFG